MDAPLSTLSFRDTLLIAVTQAIIVSGKYHVNDVPKYTKQVVDEITAIRSVDITSRYGKKDDR